MDVLSVAKDITLDKKNASHVIAAFDIFAEGGHGMYSFTIDVGDALYVPPGYVVVESVKPVEIPENKERQQSALVSKAVSRAACGIRMTIVTDNPRHMEFYNGIIELYASHPDTAPHVQKMTKFAKSWKQNLSQTTPRISEVDALEPYSARAVEPPLPPPADRLNLNESYTST